MPPDDIAAAYRFLLMPPLSAMIAFISLFAFAAMTPIIAAHRVSCRFLSSVDFFIRWLFMSAIVIGC